MAPLRTRIPGSGYTIMKWRGDIIAFCERVTNTSPAAVAPPQPIQPLNAIRPVEIVAAGAQSNGTITLTLTELYNGHIWFQLAGLSGSTDLADISRSVHNMGRGADGIYITQHINPPRGTNIDPYNITYYNCVINTANVGDTIDVTTVRQDKDIELWYTHYTFGRGGHQQNPLFATEQTG